MARASDPVTFTLTPGQQVIPEPLITLRSKRGLRMRVSRRG